MEKDVGTTIIELLDGRLTQAEIEAMSDTRLSVLAVLLMGAAKAVSTEQKKRLTKRADRITKDLHAAAKRIRRMKAN